MDWLEASQTTFWASVWAAGFLACLCRTLADDAFESCRISIAVSGISGFIGCAVVAFLSQWSGDIRGSEWSFISASALIGIGGRQLQKGMQKYLVGGILKKLGINLDEEDEKQRTR